MWIWSSINFYPSFLNYYYTLALIRILNLGSAYSILISVIDKNYWDQ